MFSHLVLLAGLCAYSCPCSKMGANVARGLAMVVASGFRTLCLHKGDLHNAYSIKFYMDAAISICLY